MTAHDRTRCVQRAGCTCPCPACEEMRIADQWVRLARKPETPKDTRR